LIVGPAKHGSGGGAAMLAVVAVDVDGACDFPGQASQHLLSWDGNAVVADRDMYVPQAVPTRTLYVGRQSIDAHHRLYSQPR
jgi:hypothetical protein